MYLSSMLLVSQLFTYPIKSLGGVSLSSAVVSDRGLQYDRRWLLIDNDNQFLTQRAISNMALLQVELREKGLKVFQKKQPGNFIHIPFETTQEKISVQIFYHYHSFAFIWSRIFSNCKEGSFANGAFTK